MLAVRWLGAAAVVFVVTAPFLLKVINRNAGPEVTVERVQSRVVQDSVLASGNLIYEDEA